MDKGVEKDGGVCQDYRPGRPPPGAYAAKKLCTKSRQSFACFVIASVQTAIERVLHGHIVNVDG